MSRFSTRSFQAALFELDSNDLILNTLCLILAFLLSTGGSHIRIYPEVDRKSAPWLFAEGGIAARGEGRVCKDSELGPWAARQG